MSDADVVRAGLAPAIPRGTRHPLWRCLLLYREIPGKFAAALGLFVVLNLSLTYYQYLVGRAVHDVERGVAVAVTPTGLDHSVALRWGTILIGVAVLRGVLQYVAGIVALITGQELLFLLRQAILRQVLRLDLGYHLSHGVGEMVARTTRDADKVRDALINFWRNVVETGLVIAASLAFLGWYQPMLAAVPAFLIVVGIAVFVYEAGQLVVLDRRVGDAYDTVSQDLVEGVGGVRVIKAFGLEKNRIARFDESVRAFAGHAARALSYSARNVPIPQVVVALGQVWVVGLGAVYVADGRLDVGELVAAALAMNTVIFRFEGIGRIIQIFADARSSAARIMDLLDAEPRIEGGAGTLPAGPLGVRLTDVTVRAGRTGDGPPIIERCNLQVNPGEIVAVVGATGSGKSTVAALLPRLIDADLGKVEIGSDASGWADSRRLRLPELRRAVQVVALESFLFSDTLAGNLRQGAPDAGPAEMARALRLAAADTIVEKLPQGLETLIGDRGLTLSGGERQRIALARALIANPAVLVLDDSTSALDALTEETVLTHLHNTPGPGGRPPAILIVASKPSTVRFADRIVVLAGGRIEAEGTQAQLRVKSRAFRDLMGMADGLN
ncbi:MAG TPA: ABC transporter ATP-binding protein [Polyangia bacterium]